MRKNIKIPPSFSLTQKGRTYLLLHDDYKELLLDQGIGDLKKFIRKHLQVTQYLHGRTPHPSILLQDEVRMVVRKYSHGGLMRFFNRDLFLLGARSYEELSLTEEIRSSGIPTIKPIGAIHQTAVYPFYRAYLLTIEVPHAKNLIQYFQEKGRNLSRENLLHKRKTIQTAGLLLRRFHHAGFYHSDLQLKNLLLDEDQVLLIDFDRSYRKPKLSVRERIKNLLRLNRSAEKWKHFGLSITRADRWRFFLAYAGEDDRIRRAIRRSLRRYSVGLIFHRIGWGLQRRGMTHNPT